MRVLALDTTTRGGSIALVDGDRVVEERRGDPARTHAERLPGDILTILQASGLGMADVDLFAVASGPGSFTGLRIGIATIQGCAIVNKRQAAGISALEALAHAASLEAAPHALVAAWMDAHRRDVFSALYRVTPAARFDPHRLIEIDEAAVGDPAATLARWADRTGGQPVVLTGDGACLYRDVILRSDPAHFIIVEPPPLAATIGRLALAHARRGETVDPAGIRPLYVRRPDAVIEKEKRSVE